MQIIVFQNSKQNRKGKTQNISKVIFRISFHAFSQYPNTKKVQKDMQVNPS